MSDLLARRGAFFQPNRVESVPFGQWGHRIVYRSYGRGTGYNSSGRFDAMQATWWIIGLNTAVFGLWQYASMNQNNKLLRQIQDNLTCSWSNIKAGRYYTMLTSAFMHHDLQHFVFNMIAFYAFGSIMGFVGVSGFQVVSLTIGSAIAGSASWLYHIKTLGGGARDSRWGPFAHRMQDVASAIGASGMVMGAAAAATCLYPTAPMHLMFIPVPIPLWVTTALYAVLDIWYLNSGSRIGHAAHLGGAVFGVLHYFAYMRGYGGIWYMIGRSIRRR